MESTISNSYSTNSVTGIYYVGGLIGSTHISTISNCYSIGSVEGRNVYVGGLVGSAYESTTISDSYWDIETSEQTTSAGGEGVFGRSTAQMTYPYAENSFVDWDFDDVWGEDVDSDLNDGYPILKWRFIPLNASSPVPNNQAVNIPLDLEEIRWTYRERTLFANPVGFKVYFNTTGEFGEEDEFDWIEYVEDQENYFCSEILPELGYETTYYWKVVPTTKENGIGEGNDAVNVPIWNFTTVDQNTYYFLEAGVIIRFVEAPPVQEISCSFHLERPAGHIIEPEESPVVNIAPVYWTITSDHPDPGVYNITFNIEGRVPGVSNPATLRLLKRDDAGSPWHDLGVADSINVLSLTWNGLDGFSDFTFGSDESNTLPVQLSSFTSLQTNAGFVQLQWTTETETNMLGYNVYRADEDVISLANAVNPQIIPANNSSQATEYRFVDEDVVSGQSYYYWLEMVDIDLTNSFYGPISVELNEEGEGGGVEPQELLTKLIGAYPNPFNPSTTIKFSLEEESDLIINIYNTKGQYIRSLTANQTWSKGIHSVVWDSKDENGNVCPTGIYLYQLKTDNGYSFIKKMMLLK